MEKLNAAFMSILVNVTLTLAKLGVGLATNSLGILAEFLHSAFDLFASIFAYWGIKQAMIPPDKDHPYGHEKYENISAFVQTALILITSVWVGYESVMRFLNPQPLESTQLGLLVMLFAIVVDYLFSRFLHKTSHEHGSAALESDAYHFTTDLWSTGAVIFGLLCANFGFPQGDSIAAFIVALFMLRLSISLGKKAFGVLVDKGASDEELGEIVSIVSATKGVKGYHNLRARHMGMRLVVDMHVLVDGKMSVVEAHNIMHKLKGRLTSEVPVVKEVLIHIEPYEELSKR